MKSLVKGEAARWLNASNNSKIELQSFCDASSKAYAAVIYVKIIKQDEVHVSLVTAKYRVAPIKTITISRLELSAALLLSKLVMKVMNETKIEFNVIKLYTDSRITLDWIIGNPKRWKTFV